MYQIVPIASAVSALIFTVVPGLATELTFDADGPLLASWRGPG